MFEITCSFARFKSEPIEVQTRLRNQRQTRFSFHVTRPIRCTGTILVQDFHEVWWKQNPPTPPHWYSFQVADIDVLLKQSQPYLLSLLWQMSTGNNIGERNIYTNLQYMTDSIERSFHCSNFYKKVNPCPPRVENNHFHVQRKTIKVNRLTRGVDTNLGPRTHTMCRFRQCACHLLEPCHRWQKRLTRKFIWIKFFGIDVLFSSLRRLIWLAFGWKAGWVQDRLMRIEVESEDPYLLHSWLLLLNYFVMHHHH